MTGTLPESNPISVDFDSLAVEPSCSIVFHSLQPEFGFISLKGWPGTILMNGC